MRAGSPLIAVALLALAYGCSPSKPRGLLGNGGFEGGAADGVSSWQGTLGDGVTLDEAVSHSGRRSLRVSRSGAGLLSDLVPYPGGRVQVTGWMTTEGVVRGSRPWRKAALQLIPHDAKGTRCTRAWQVPPTQPFTCEVPIADLARTLDTTNVVHFDLVVIRPDAGDDIHAARGAPESNADCS